LVLPSSFPNVLRQTLPAWKESVLGGHGKKPDCQELPIRFQVLLAFSMRDYVRPGDQPEQAL